MNFKNKNILLVINHGSLGGAERQAHGLSRILTEDFNCKVDLLLTFSPELTNEFRSFAEECSIRNFHHIGPPYLYLPFEFSFKNLKRFKWSIQYLLNLRKKLYPYKYHVIIPYLNAPSKLSFFLYKMLPTVRFTFWHQLGLDKWTLDIFERIAAKYTPCVISNSKTGLELFTQHYQVEQKKQHVLPQYVSLIYKEVDPYLLKEQLAIDEKDLVIGMVAQYRFDKYHELLLEVFEKLLKKYPNSHLVFLGNKESTKTTQQKYNLLRKKINEKKITSKVSLLSRREVAEILNVFDIGVLISEIEGMPNAVMEYMEYGLPVVASNHQGCRDLLKDSDFLVKTEEKDIYRSLEELVTNKNLRKAEGLKNKERIKGFNSKTYMNQLEVIINKSPDNE